PCAGGAGDLGRAPCRGEGRAGRPARVRDRPGALPWPGKGGSLASVDRQWATALWDDRRRAGPDLRASTAGAAGARGDGADRLLDRSRLVSRGTARPDRQAPRYRRLRARRRARLDPGPGATAPPG